MSWDEPDCGDGLFESSVFQNWLKTKQNEAMCILEDYIDPSIVDDVAKVICKAWLAGQVTFLDDEDEWTEAHAAALSDNDDLLEKCFYEDYEETYD